MSILPTLVCRLREPSEVRPLSTAGSRPAGCTETRIVERQIDRDWPFGDHRDQHLVAVDLAGSLLAVWTAGDRGGLRMRMAKPELFAKAPDVVLFDDLVAGGKVSADSALLGFRLFAREPSSSSARWPGCTRCGSTSTAVCAPGRRTFRKRSRSDAE